MNIASACVECIINQAKRVGKTLSVDETTQKLLVDEALRQSKNFSFLQTPPEVAAPLYHEIAKILQTDDIYHEIKQKSTKKAYELLPTLEQKIQKSSNLFETALRVAVLGNVIDLASEVIFDIDEEIAKIFTTPFAIDNSKELFLLLEKAQEVVVLGDNVGEHLFDKLAIKTLQKLFPNITFYYFVRSRPIINDVTLKEALEVGLDKVCEVVDSGVDTPGFVYNKASQKAQELFNRCDVVLSKGMGNYECLTPSHKSPIAFLLKVKCQVVASSLDADVGDIVCKVV